MRKGELITFQGTNISPTKAPFEHDFPLPKVGYVSSLEGKLRIVSFFDGFPDWKGPIAVALTET